MPKSDPMSGYSRKKASSALAIAACLAVAAGVVATPAGAASARGGDSARPSLLPRHSSGRVTIVVSTDLQQLTVYDDGVPVATTTVSTGVADHPTPHGIFSVIGKERFHRSNLDSDAPMPWMQRITWSGVALHEGRVTGRPASHGCIRMPPAFAVELYRYTREGARVVIARDDVVPTPWGSLPPFDAGLRKLAASAPPPPAARETSSARYDLEIEARPRVSWPPPQVTRRDLAARAPLNMLVNRRTGKLYVRRAFAPVFQVPVTIDDPTRPLGTHMFVMQDNTSRWLATSIDDTPVLEASLLDDGRRGRRARDAQQAIVLPASRAMDALSRLHLPPGTDAYIASLLTPGATLILSDDGARNRETWDGTNFIALSE